MTLAIIFIYLGLVLAIGLLSHRLLRRTGEDYFLASRSIGPFVLLMTLFGTNMTSFAILGASGEAYRQGIGVFALMASSSAIVIPAIFFFVGTKLWRLGKRHGYLTQIQFIRDRYQSNGLAILLFITLAALLIPYLLIGVMGAGMTFEQMTDGRIPYWLGGLLVCLVVFFYISYSGMRGASWVNTFQALVFMTLGAVAFFIIIRKLGGLDAAMAQVAERQPELLARGDKISPALLLSYTLIPVSAGMFPHIFAHWLTARSAETFKMPIIFYPICMIVVWAPSVLIGVMGVIDFPGLQGPAANDILIRMVELYAPGVLGGLLAAGVFAAIMSSLDSQTLALGNMFTQDIVRHYSFREEMSETKQVVYGRLFVCLILAIAFGLSLVLDRSIFKLGIWSFTGFASLFPIVVAALYWKRSTKWGAIAATLVTAGSWIYFFSQGSKTIEGTDVMAVAATMGLSALAMIVGSLATQPPGPKTLAKFFED